MTLQAPISSTQTLTDVAAQLVHAALDDHPGEREITLLAVSVSNLCNEMPMQLELPLTGRAGHAVGGPNSATESARRSADRSVDAIRKKFGPAAVGYATVTLSEGHQVPDEFRELAEHPISG
jgi:DNA polymerase-4